jgi:DNA-binding LacI/PurR family transcriptional regulator
MPDNTGGMFKAVEYLTRNGHKKIAFLGSSPEYSIYSFNYAERFHGFSMACTYYKVASVSAMLHHTVKFSPENIEAVENIYDKWKKMKNPPTAVISVNHMYGAILRTIDSDIPVIAGDNKKENNENKIKISVLEQDVEAMGQMATELLLKRIKAPSRIPVRLNCNVKLIC